MELRVIKGEDKTLEILMDGMTLKHARKLEVSATAYGKSEVTIDLVDIPFNLTFYPKDTFYKNQATGVEYVLQERWKYELELELHELLREILITLQDAPNSIGDRVVLAKVKHVLLPYLHGKDES